MTNFLIFYCFINCPVFIQSQYITYCQDLQLYINIIIISLLKILKIYM